MNKIFRFLSIVLVSSALGLFFHSCLGSDNNDVKVDEAWKNHNEKLFNDENATGDYNKYYSPMFYPSTEYILAKPSTTMAGLQDKAINYDVVEFTDSVCCRYTGWYIDKENKKYIFDSTEVTPTGSYTSPNSVPVGFLVSGVIDGWRTALYNMKVGDELEIVVPYTLGYGQYGSAAIPGYTTLFYNLKLVKLVKMKTQG